MVSYLICAIFFSLLLASCGNGVNHALRNTQDHKPILARFSVTPTPPLPSPLCASPPFTAPDGSFAFYPQLKFFELAGHDLVRFFFGTVSCKESVALMLTF
jgi:hypothetical protein